VSIALDNQCRQRCLVKGNENEIFQVVVNLLKNAAEALPTGGEITIQAFPESRHAHLVVSDTGVGIADTDLSRIFEPFWSTKQFQGTGMGLASSYGIVQAHGGELTVQSQFGQGAVFRVRLPLCAEAEQACPQAEQVCEPGYVERSILLVDDVPAVTKQLQVALGRHGHTVFAASSGEEALRIFRETPIDVVVCDLAMPKMNGWQVGEAIRDICRERGVPRPVFIMLTGWGGQISDPSGMNEAGVDAIVEKPVDSTQLLRIITDAADRPPPG
jgi:CheY-like chemotaxis protein